VYLVEGLARRAGVSKQTVSSLRSPTAKLPAGLDALSALDGELGPRRVDQTHAGDDEIDWGAAYSALEVIEQDLHDRGLSDPPPREGEVPAEEGTSTDREPRHSLTPGALSSNTPPSRSHRAALSGVFRGDPDGQSGPAGGVDYLRRLVGYAKLIERSLGLGAPAPAVEMCCV